MRHINLKRLTKKELEDNLAIVDYPEDSTSYSIRYLPTGQYMDHDFVVRKTDPKYAGIWFDHDSAVEAGKKLLSNLKGGKHV